MTATPKQITIDVEGAVGKPGVYKVVASGRVQDALIAAGGFSQSADRQQFAKVLNLVAPLAGDVPNFTSLPLVSK